MAPVIVFCLVVLFGAAISDQASIETRIDTGFFEKSGAWEGRIVGGWNAALGQFPHQVAIRLANGNYHCGGSILSQNYILSAAHCFSRYTLNPANIRVAVGTIRRVNDGVVYSVSAILNHPQYDAQSFFNNIAILRTATPILFNSANIRAINLPTRPAADGLPLAVSGWGQTGDRLNVNELFPVPAVLQFKITANLNLQECRRRAGRQAHYIFNNTLCTTNPVGRGTCIGDAGSPVIGQDGAQYGIVSWGVPCGRGFPDYHTNVFAHLEWIQSAIAV